VSGEVGDTNCSLLVEATMTSAFSKSATFAGWRGARAIRLDVFDGGIEASDAEGIRPVFRTLFGEQLVAAGGGELVEGCSGFGGE